MHACVIDGEARILVCLILKSLYAHKDKDQNPCMLDLEILVRRLQNKLS
jgi:hypothetical protein